MDEMRKRCNFRCGTGGNESVYDRGRNACWEEKVVGENQRCKRDRHEKYGDSDPCRETGLGVEKKGCKDK